MLGVETDANINNLTNNLNNIDASNFQIIISSKLNTNDILPKII